LGKSLINLQKEINFFRQFGAPFFLGWFLAATGLIKIKQMPSAAKKICFAV